MLHLEADLEGGKLNEPGQEKWQIPGSGLSMQSHVITMHRRLTPGFTEKESHL